MADEGEEPFRGLPNPLECGRYHSLRVCEQGLPPELVKSAWTDEGTVMGVRHRELPRFGVQFHPESILTPAGDRLLARFLMLCGEL